MHSRQMVMTRKKVYDMIEVRRSIYFVYFYQYHIDRIVSNFESLIAISLLVLAVVVLVRNLLIIIKNAQLLIN